VTYGVRVEGVRPSQVQWVREPPQAFEYAFPGVLDLQVSCGFAVRPSLFI
jgi:hypothetical protein